MAWGAEATKARTLDSDHLMILVLALAGWWATVPQVARMMTGADESDVDEDARRRASVVEAVRWMAVVG